MSGWILQTYSHRILAVMKAKAFQHENDARYVVIGGADERDQALEGVLSHYTQTRHVVTNYSHTRASIGPMAIELSYGELVGLKVSTEELPHGYATSIHSFFFHPLHFTNRPVCIYTYMKE